MKSWEPMSPVVLSVRVLERDICVRAIFLDEGMSVLLAGGDKTHIGAVSIKEPGRSVVTVCLEGHREDCISERWAVALGEAIDQTVCVQCGIHYDYLSRSGIEQVLEACNQLLEKIMNILK